MTRRDKKQPLKVRPAAQTPPPEPIDVVDGIADRTPAPPRWKRLVLAGVFVAWVAFMLYCQMAGAPAK